MILEKFAEEEMKRAGLYDKDSDYGGMLPKAVMALIKAHAAQGHSGMSHSITLSIFNKVVNFKPLTPITNDPSEWTDVSGYGAPQDAALWQCNRDSALFSNDGGKTYYSVDDLKRELKTSENFAAAPKEEAEQKENE